MDSLTRAKQEAKRLRLEVAALGAPVPLTVDQSLNLAARINGHKDWHDLSASQQLRYFFDRHEPYQPNSHALVRALSVRKATLADLAEIEVKLSEQPDNWSPLCVVALATERAMRQARQALQGATPVGQELLDALTSGVTRNLLELRQEESFAELAFSKTSTGGSGRSMGFYGGLVKTDDAQARAYHASYVRWRLASLAATLCAICDRKGAPAFAELQLGGADLFTYAGAVLSESRTPKLSKEESYAAQVLGKTVLLSILSSGSMEPSLQFKSGSLVTDADKMGQRLLERFPEIAFWQAWVELKPLLAESIDELVP